ncbi:hypothetical protein AOL_s00080g322 [Orbilia oligospora ATCC 24927]|uniref:Uncharacterized protein n=1 Tax=Arthrobotrys oligospora (strain ATCC 24927 / CBS 115.81 / DSM 1491) TaxID=756982 RepID=G1XET7_ARTOA|nr:hypothetical protein AOL_s00080g322 [Orbilia oligospora ATCC 24927]EGX48352.1 hypothetical protein AOL_s00080g322 [Orbilia oligospora ATCC 24927]
MPRTKILGTKLRAVALLLGWVPFIDAYYFAAVKSDPTIPQGLPVWGWQPVGAADDMGCKVGGTQQLGWLQAFGVLNQQTPPNNWPNGNAEGFIFYSDENCHLEQSEKILYVKFDPNSVKAQVVNFRNLPWELDIETTISLADSKYKSYREVRANDADLQKFLPEQIQEMPTTYVYAATPYFEEEGRMIWGGDAVEGVISLNISPPQQGTAPNPRATVFDALLSLMSGLGQDLGNQQRLLLYADDAMRSLGLGVMPPNVGVYKASPVSKVLDFNTINMNLAPDNANNNFFNPNQAQNTGMNIEEPVQEAQDIMPRINLPLYGDTENNQQIETRGRRMRFNHPYFEDLEEGSELQEEQIPEGEPLNLANFEPRQEYFDPIGVMRDLLARWQNVLQENAIIEETAVRRYNQDTSQNTRDRLREALQLMDNGRAWTQNVEATTQALVDAQRLYLEDLQELEEQHKIEAGLYQSELDAIQDVKSEYESSFVPSQELTAKYEMIGAAMNQAQELYEGAVDTLERQHHRYSWEYSLNENDFYEYYVKVFRYFRRIEVRLRVLRDELGLGPDSPVAIYGLRGDDELRDDDTGEVYRHPSSYNEQIALLNLGGMDDFNVAQNYEESKEQSEEGEEITFQQQQQVINSSPEESGDMNYTGGTNVNPDATDFDPDSLL